MPATASTAGGPQFVAAQVTQVQGDSLAAGLEQDWEDNVRKTVGAYAYVTTLVDRLSLDQVQRLVGAQNIAAAQKFLERFRRDHRVAQKLRDGRAVLVGYQRPGSTDIWIGVYKAASAHSLGVAPFVWFALAAGTILTSTAFYFKNWGMELRKYRAESDQLYLEMANRISVTVQDVAKRDPAAAARIAEAGAQAMRAATEARRTPADWIDKIIGAAERTGGALLNSPLVWLGVFWAFSQRKGRA